MDTVAFGENAPQKTPPSDIIGICRPVKIDFVYVRRNNLVKILLAEDSRSYRVHTASPPRVDVDPDYLYEKHLASAKGQIESVM